ncbi:MAG: ABC transporter ATP-binding protein [Actinobacteria bacterium]|nr:ABC transporter ATP-binding protein [Actinomycetota bacterium]MCB9413162.1 ABC transporter ATP-binding protein [Actinomycetota bacterium]
MTPASQLVTTAEPVTTDPSHNQVAVSARSLSKTYGTGPTAVHALRSVNLDIERGRFSAIMGPSGSGKSTLLHLLAGLDTASAGSVRIDGQELGALGDDALTRLRRDRVGFVFQSFNLIPTLTAAENIRLPLDLAGRQPDRAWFDYVIASVGIADRLNHRPSELSGGQRQRVAVARALVTRPAVAFADEPTGNLDSVSGAEVLRLLRDAVTHAGQTVVMVTHDPAAAAHADRVVMLADGMIRHDLIAPGLDAIVAAVASGSASA